MSKKRVKDILATSTFVAATLLGLQKANADTSVLQYNGQTGDDAVASLVKSLKENVETRIREKLATTILEYGQNLPAFLGTPLDVGADFCVDQSLSVEGLPQWAKDEHAKYCAGARMDINRYREQLRGSGWLDADGKLDLTRCPEIVETILPAGSRFYLGGRSWDLDTGEEDPVLHSRSYRADHKALGRLLSLQDANKRRIALVRVDSNGAHLSGEDPDVVTGDLIMMMIVHPKEQTFCSHIANRVFGGIEVYTQSPEISYESEKDKVQSEELKETPATEPSLEPQPLGKVPAGKLTPDLRSSPT